MVNPVTDLITVAAGQVEALKVQAEAAPLRRTRICLHQSHQDAIQEMVVVFCRDSYVCPHRHGQKSESLHVIEGELMVVFFDEQGNITRRLAMGGPGQPFLYRLSANRWHTVVALSEFIVFHEAVCGPFGPGETAFAPWAPLAHDAPGASAYLASLRASGDIP